MYFLILNLKVMLTKIKLPILAGCLSTGLICLLMNACNNSGQSTPPNHDQMVTQGKYLVSAMGCNDCHTPMKMTAIGPVPDSSRFLSGAPQQDSMSQPFTRDEIALAKSGAVIFLTSGGILGGWGVSFPANLTPDSTTGIGGWNTTLFRNVFRLGKYMGIPTGRPLMPPMPYPSINHLTDEDLNSIFAYLQTIPAVHNQVPQYIPFDKIPVKN